MYNQILVLDPRAYHSPKEALLNAPQEGESPIADRAPREKKRRAYNVLLYLGAAECSKSTSENVSSW